MLKCSTYELWEKDNEFSVLYPEFIHVYKADEVDADKKKDTERIQTLEKELKKERKWKNWWRQKAIDNRNHKQTITERPN